MHVTAVVPAAGAGTQFGGAVPKQYLRSAGPDSHATLQALAASRRGGLPHSGGAPRAGDALPDGDLEPFGWTVDRLVPGGRTAGVGFAGLPQAPTRRTWCWSTMGPVPGHDRAVSARRGGRDRSRRSVVAVPVRTRSRWSTPTAEWWRRRAGPALGCADPAGLPGGVVREAHARGLAGRVPGDRRQRPGGAARPPGATGAGSRGESQDYDDSRPRSGGADPAGTRRPMTPDHVPRRRGGAPVLRREWGSPRRVACIRVGVGFDMHRLVSGRPLILGGVQIPFERGLEGDSDAVVPSRTPSWTRSGRGRVGRYRQPFRSRSTGEHRDLQPPAPGAGRWPSSRPGIPGDNVDATVVAEAPRRVPSFRPCDDAGRVC